jgi:hypothetical protein
MEMIITEREIIPINVGDHDALYLELGNPK